LNSINNSPFLRKLFSLIFVHVLFSVSANCFATTATDSSSLVLPLPHGLRATLSFTHNQVIAQLPNNKRIVLANNINQIPAYARDIWIDDFNFDGRQDAAITTGFDPVSSDQMYTIFIWDDGLSQFFPLTFREKLTNLEIVPKHKEIRSSYQSRNFWVEDTYRFQNRQPYLYSRSRLIANDIWHTTIYNPAGQTVRSLVSRDGRVERPPYPVLLSVTSQTAPLYRQPLPSTLLPIKLNRGDVVSVLDFKNDPGHFYWVNISANINQHVIRGWTLLSNLIQQ